MDRLKINGYRQIVITISRKYCREKRFKEKKRNLEESEGWDEDGLDSIARHRGWPAGMQFSPQLPRETRGRLRITINHLMSHHNPYRSYQFHPKSSPSRRNFQPSLLQPLFATWPIQRVRIYFQIDPIGMKMVTGCLRAMTLLYAGVQKIRRHRQIYASSAKRSTCDI